MGCNDSKPFPDFPDKYITRFWSKVDIQGPDDCWLWMAGTAKNGYGKYGFLYGGSRYDILPHRLALFLKIGNFAPLCACHDCDTRYQIDDLTYRRCCNPDHLFPATGGENQNDRTAKGRTAKGDRNGTRLYPERLHRGEKWREFHSKTRT